MLAAVGRVNGTPRGGLLLRRHRHGRRDGRRGLQGRRRRLPPGDDRPGADHRPLALRRRPAGRGRAVAARGRPDLPRDDPGVGQDPADLGGARPGGRRCGVRAGADRRGDPRPRGPDLRHRTRRRPLGHRRGRRHAPARRPRAARPPLRRRPHPHRERGRGARAGAHRRLAARRPGHLDVAAVEDRDLSQVLPESKQARLRRAPARRRASSTTGTMQELHERWAPNIVTALGRFGGRTVGVDRQQPAPPRRLPRLAVGREGVPLRADVRRLRRSR